MNEGLHTRVASFSLWHTMARQAVLLYRYEPAEPLPSSYSFQEGKRNMAGLELDLQKFVNIVIRRKDCSIGGLFSYARKRGTQWHTRAY